MKPPTKSRFFNRKKYLPVFLFAFLSLNHSLSAQPFFTQGIGNILITDMMPACPSNHITPLGSISSVDGSNWTVPADVHFYTANHLPDLHNSCNGITPANLSQVNTANLPEVIIDPNGQTITAFLFCDNYFELYINGVLVGVDPVPFTPFNSCMVKFRVSLPYTIAVAMVDWEEHPGLGSEIQTGDNYHPGDGGFIAKFSDGTITDTSWKAQVFYIAPLEQAGGIVHLANGTRSTAGITNAPTCNANCFGAHYPVDTNWINPLFDDSSWPHAVTYAASLVTNQPAYVNFATSAWSNAQFIWSSNLILDNLVLARKTVTGTVGAVKEKILNEWRMYETASRKLLLLPPDGSGQFKASLFDVLGNKLYEWNVEHASHETGIELQLPYRLAAMELYVLKVDTGNNSFAKKLMLTGR